MENFIGKTSFIKFANQQTLDEGFSPSQIAELSLWLDASYAQSLITDGAANFTSANSEFLSSASADCNIGAGESATIGFWVKTTDVSADVISNSPGGTPLWRIQFDAGGDLNFRVNDGVVNVAIDGGSGFNDGEWHFIVGALDRTADVIKLYGDGAFLGSGDITGLGAVGDSELSIGSFSGTSSFFDGAVDSAFIAKRVYTDAEINYLYNSGAGRTYLDVADAAIQSPSLDTKDFGASGNFTQATDAYIDIPTITPTAFTMGMWVYARSFATDTSFPTLIGSIGGDRVYMNTDGEVLLRIDSTNTDFTGSSSFAINTWTHIAIRWTGTAYSLFINGVQSGANITSSTALSFRRIGALSSSNGRFNGLITDVKIYETAFTDAEILAMYNGADDTSAASRYYKLNSNADDSTSNAQDGTWAAAESYSEDVPCSGELLTSSSLVAWWDLDEPSGTRLDAHGSNDLTDNNTVTGANGIGAGQATDGDPISQWSDRSGNGNHVTEDTYANKPLMTVDGDSKPGVKYDEATHRLASADGAPLESLFLAFTPLNGYDSAEINGRFLGVDGQPMGFAKGSGTGILTNEILWTFEVDNGRSGYTSAVDVIPNDTRVLIAFVWNGGDYDIYVDGVNKQNATNDSNSVIDFTDGFAVGNTGSANYTLNGVIHELIGYGTAPTDSERAQLETYLANKWGITL